MECGVVDTICVDRYPFSQDSVQHKRDGLPKRDGVEDGESEKEETVKDDAGKEVQPLEKQAQYARR